MVVVGNEEDRDEEEAVDVVEAGNDCAAGYGAGIGASELERLRLVRVNI